MATVGPIPLLPMRTIVENLLTLQKLLLPPAAPTPEQQAKITELRKLVPPPVLTHFDRLVVRGKNGVALVRHGVCTECHIRVPIGTLAGLIAPRDVYLCDSCSCYLLLPLEEVPGALSQTAAKPAARRATRAKKSVPAAASVPSVGL
jgi:hypothetical protein